MGDMMFSMMNGLAGGLGAGATLDGLLGPVVGGVAGGSPQQGAFGNLLDLVSDMQMADEQGLAQVDYLNDRVGELFDPEQENLKTGAHESELQQAIQAAVSGNANLAEPIGPKAMPKGVVPGMDKVAKPFNELSTVDVAGLKDLGTARRSLDGRKAESAKIWASAIATGDLTSVEIEPDTVTAQPAPLASEALVKASASGKPEQAWTELRTTTTSAAEVSGAEVTAPEAKAPKVTADPAKGPATAVASTSASVTATKRDTSSKERGQGEGFERAQPKIVESKPRAKSGSEFLLEKSVFHAEGQKAPQALEASAKLGTFGDRRISSETLDFVADKIESLRAQGGGNLRIELNPRDLGAIQVKVIAQRGGTLRVEVKAENAETAKIFAASSTSLRAKLETIAPTTLEVAHASTHAKDRPVELHRVRDMAEAHASKATMSLSNDGGAASTADAGSSGDTGFRDSDSNRGDQRSTTGNDWFTGRSDSRTATDGRDEKRERAMRDWELFRERLSA